METNRYFWFLFVTTPQRFPTMSVTYRPLSGKSVDPAESYDPDFAMLVPLEDGEQLLWSEKGKHRPLLFCTLELLENDCYAFVFSFKTQFKQAIFYRCL
jgi:hypothetical protein